MADKNKKLAKRVMRSCGYSYQAALNLIRAEVEQLGNEAGRESVLAMLEEVEHQNG